MSSYCSECGFFVADNKTCEMCDYAYSPWKHEPVTHNQASHETEPASTGPESGAENWWQLSVASLIMLLLTTYAMMTTPQNPPLLAHLMAVGLAIVGILKDIRYIATYRTGWTPNIPTWQLILFIVGVTGGLFAVLIIPYYLARRRYHSEPPAELTEG